MSFRTTLAAGFVAAVAASLSASPAYAFAFQFDESGNGCVLNSDSHCETVSNGILGPDPTGRVSGDVLIFTLPDLVGEGDVGIGEFGTNTLSDLLTFTDANGSLNSIGNLMIFYSEAGGGAAADSGLPVGEFSIGATENADGSFIYNIGNIYIGESPETVGVPEPITLSLFGAGLAGAVALRRRKKK